MYVSICNSSFDIDSPIELLASESSDFDYLKRAVSPQNTTGIQSNFIDFGFAPSNGSINIVIDAINNSPELKQRLENLMRFSQYVCVSCREGFFVCIIKEITNYSSDLNINLYIVGMIGNSNFSRINGG